MWRALPLGVDVVCDTVADGPILDPAAIYRRLTLAAD
jgi:hypothetical protein